MEKWERENRNKGGRPPKTIKRNRLIGVKCTTTEYETIVARAASVGLSLSVYLRQIGLTGRIDHRQISLPPSLLELKAELHHVGANFNQLIRVCHTYHVLNPEQELLAISIIRKIDAVLGRVEKCFQ